MGFLGEVVFSRATDFTRGKITQVNFRAEVTENNEKCPKKNP